MFIDPLLGYSFGMRLSPVLLTPLLVAPLSAAIVFSENFDGLTAGAAIGDANTAFTDSFNGSGASQIATLDSSNLFLNGPTNIFNRSQDNSTSTSVRINFNGSLGTSDIATYSWSFYNAATSPTGGYAWRLSTVPDAQSTYSVQVNFTPATGNIIDVAGAFSNQTLYRVDVVANTSASILNFNDGNGNARSLAPDSFSVFLTDLTTLVQSAVKDNVAFNGTVSGAGFDSIAFQSFNGATGHDVYWDDVIVRDEVFVTPIPEPSSTALAAAALGLLAMAMRRRKS